MFLFVYELVSVRKQKKNAKQKVSLSLIVLCMVVVVARHFLYGFPFFFDGEKWGRTRFYASLLLFLPYLNDFLSFRKKKEEVNHK